MNETSEHKIERLRDVIWKLEKQMDELGDVAASRLELLRRCRDAIASQAENLIEYEYYKEAAQFEELEKELAEELGGD